MSSQYPLEFITRGSGFTANEIAGEALGNKKLVYRNALGTWSLADASAAATMPTLGITMGDISTGKKGEILLQGYIGYATWTWTPGGEIYATDTPGELSQVAGTIEQIVAVAITATIIQFGSDFNNGGAGADTIIVRKNSGANVGSQPRLNFIEGTDISLTIADDPANTEIDITVTNTGPAAHAATHSDGAADEVEIDDLAGANGAAGEIVESDGAAMSFVEPDGRYAPAAHAASHENAGGDEISVLGLSGELADAQPVAVSKNSGAIVGTRSELNFIEGANVTLTIVDDPAGDEVDITIAAPVAGDTFLPTTIVTSGAGADLQTALNALPATGGMVYAKAVHWDIGTQIVVGENEALVFQPFCEIEPTANVDLFKQLKNSLIDGNGAHINLRDYGSWVGKDVFQFDGADDFGQFATDTHWTVLRNFHILGETAGNETGNGIHMWCDADNEYVAYVQCDNIHFERMAAAIKITNTAGSAGNQSWISENRFTRMRGGANLVCIDMERDDTIAGNYCNMSGNYFEFRESVGANNTYLYRIHGRMNRINDYSVDFDNIGTAAVEFRTDDDSFTRDNWVTFNRTGVTRDEVLNNDKWNHVQGIKEDANHFRNPYSIAASEEATAGTTLVESEPLMLSYERWTGAARVTSDALITVRPNLAGTDDAALELRNFEFTGTGGADSGVYLAVRDDNTGTRYKIKLYADTA